MENHFFPKLRDISLTGFFEKFEKLEGSLWTRSLGPQTLWLWTMFGCFANFHVHLSKNCKGFKKNHGHRKLQWTFACENPLSILWATKMPARKLDFYGTVPLEI
jgi:hypothetical protein